MINNGRLDRHRQRDEVARRVLGRGLVEDTPPEPIPLQLTRREAGNAASGPITEYGEDAAEFAALAEDGWLALHLQQRERSYEEGSQLLAAMAYLVEPGPAILIVAEHGIVDRLVAGRVRPIPASSLAPGMRVMTANASGGVFASIRPRLDRIQGVGTRFWLDQWDDALRSAVAATGSPTALAAVLEQRGASISSQAVASWASPYRIGPRDAANVARVGDVGGHVVAAHNYLRVHAVMRGVRVLHGQLGRQLASAMRRYVDGDVYAFDAVEERLGIDIETMVGDPTSYTVQERLAAGAAPAHALGRAHTVAAAQHLFHRQEAS
jgi:hypothetical protein